MAFPDFKNAGDVLIFFINHLIHKGMVILSSSKVHYLAEDISVHLLWKKVILLEILNDLDAFACLGFGGVLTFQYGFFVILYL